MANPAGTLKQAKTAGNELTDSEFKTACSLLPHVLKLIRALYSGMEAQSVHTLAVELSGQVQRCHAVIDSSPALQLSNQEQRALLDNKMAQLKERSHLLSSYRQLDIFHN